MQLNIGDVVRIKSGGPDMVIRKVNDTTGHFRCQWFDGKQLREGDFAPESLVRSDQSAPGTASGTPPGTTSP